MGRWQREALNMGRATLTLSWLRGARCTAVAGTQSGWALRLEVVSGRQGGDGRLTVLPTKGSASGRGGLT